MIRDKEVTEKMKLNKLGELFAAPLQSATRAQNLALQETISFIEQFALEEGQVRSFRFKAERLVEERKVDPKTGIAETQFTVQPFEMSIPILALVQTPYMQLQEMNVEFGVDIVETTTEPFKSAVIPSAVLGSSLASSRSVFTSLSQSNPTTMKVNMKIVREMPEGMARVADALTDLLNAIPKDIKPSTNTTGTPIEEVQGIGRDFGAILRAQGILTTRHFLKATETPESREKLAESTKISLKRIEDWRDKAILLEESGT